MRYLAIGDRPIERPTNVYQHDGDGGDGSGPVSARLLLGPPSGATSAPAFQARWGCLHVSVSVVLLCVASVYVASGGPLLLATFLLKLNHIIPNCVAMGQAYVTVLCSS